MSNDLQSELEALRARVAELSSQPPPAADAATSAAAQLSVDAVPAAVLRLLKEWLEALRRDVDQSKPSALVASFLAGVAVGRLLR